MQEIKEIKFNKYKYFIVSFGLVIFLLLAVFASRWIFSSSVFNRYFESGSNISPYYAAFLSNGQVYFGKLLKYDRKALVLSEVYYLRLDETEPQGLAQRPNPNQQGIPRGVEEPQFSLVKLGSEIHGPTDKLFINPDYLMFFEQLRSDSRVVQSINQSP